MADKIIIGIGIDLVKSDRIKKAVRKWDKRFLNRIFTPLEQEYAFAHKVPYLHLAGRFAVKEAVMKALGTGWSGGVRWNEIGVINEPADGPDRSRTGKPRVEVAGKVKALMDERGVKEIQVSISHDTDYSIAQVVLIG
ncbi:MAG: holo-ACP synthase [Nitrospirae bacterium]|nr:holo-ACP synthase [Nitrospirota bacterium]